MATSITDYHKTFNLTRPLSNEMLGMSTSQLLDDREVLSDLLASPWVKESDTSYLEWYLKQVVAEIERRRERYQAHRDDSFPPVWPSQSDFDRWRAQAEAVKEQLSVERYL